MKLNNRVLASVAVAVAVIAGLTLLLPRQAPEAPMAPSAFVVQPGRQLDFGFKHKVNDCMVTPEGDWLVVDVDDNSSYVLADAKRFYMGPHPITDADLKKVVAVDFDKRADVTPTSCGDLETRYLSSQTK